jgi:signal transduction histidine kinase
VRLRLTLYQRFLTANLLLLVLLVGSILLVIDQRESSAAFEESRTRGILIAQNIANLNLEPLFFYDLEAIKKNIEERIDDSLLFVVFYDRFNAPLVSSELVKKYDDIFCCSRMMPDATPQSFAFASRTLKKNNRTVRVLEVEMPIFARGSATRWGSIKVGLSLEYVHVRIRRTRLVLILIGLGGLLFGAFGAALLARRISGPIKDLAKSTIRISRGDFSHRLVLRSQDEVGQLAASFNAMSEQLQQTQREKEEANRRLIQAEKLASIGRIAATIAHEIRNPLTSVKLNIQKLAQLERLGEIEREHLILSQEGINQIEKFIKGFLDYTRATELRLDRFSVEQILEESLKMLRQAFEQKQVAVEKSYQPGLPEILVDGDKLRDVFTNVLRNALEAVEEGGGVRVTLSRLIGQGENRLRIRIEDNGPGIPEELGETIFEPFFTTKATGVGLGLANARKILELHQGTIRVEKTGRTGTVLDIELPIRGAHEIRSDHR